MSGYGTQVNVPPKRPALTRNLLLATAVACLGSIQYGYHIAELNAPEQFLVCPNDSHSSGIINSSPQCITMTDQQFGAVTSIFSIGGLVGSFFIGNYASKYGRRLTSLYVSVLAFLGSLVMFMAGSFNSLLLGRFIVGISCGSAIVITPLFINEIAPSQWKGALGSMNQLSINLGILLTQTLALPLANLQDWRWLLAVGCILALLNALGWWYVGESPQWLVLHEHDTMKASINLAYLRDCSLQTAKQEMEQWVESSNNNNSESHDATQELTFWGYITNPTYQRPRLAITLLLVGQQFSGINSIIFYGVKVVSQVVSQYAILVNFAISILNVIVTFIAGLIIDRSGRKPLLIVSTLVMSLMSLIISISIISGHSIMLIVSLFGFIIAFALGIGPIPFLIIGELSSAESMEQAQSYGTVCNWLATFVIGYTFPILNNVMGGYVYLTFSAMTVLLLVGIRKYVPETKGTLNANEAWQTFN
ncbi:similar to Saccharomyces cerevisiae YGL104C VPS73 Mitochondrial protein [Maudiozyma saulgeensis]|uniref:Similar to Saccharomyces cerevisiae YGL104C VPS73 Mitochondrial protein n=1 Tax=Maudiozyma saulgeensis TaxID=1789683 RepID=A0A1X7RA77_9SACH|nr:similar to Saccharomyces cerevisiae YGL104C VPS73 Mitochondrial protein [Kazachstania saulgeensis]